jgi:hypothetical protein
VQQIRIATRYVPVSRLGVLDAPLRLLTASGRLQGIVTKQGRTRARNVEVLPNGRGGGNTRRMPRTQSGICQPAARRIHSGVGRQVLLYSTSTLVAVGADVEPKVPFPAMQQTKGYNLSPFPINFHMMDRKVYEAESSRAVDLSHGQDDSIAGRSVQCGLMGFADCCQR